MKWKVTCCVFEVDDGACLKDAVSRLDVVSDRFWNQQTKCWFCRFFLVSNRGWTCRPSPAQPSPPHSQQNGSSGAGGRAAWERALFPPAAGLIQLCGSLNLGEKKRASGLTPVAGPFMGGLHVLAALRSPRVSSWCPKTSGCWIGKIGNRSYVINSFFLTTGDFVYLLPLELEKVLASFHV